MGSIVNIYPICDECGIEMHRYTDPNTGVEGWSCDLCGWSWDDEKRADAKPSKPRNRIMTAYYVQDPKTGKYWRKGHYSGEWVDDIKKAKRYKRVSDASLSINCIRPRVKQVNVIEFELVPTGKVIVKP